MIRRRWSVAHMPRRGMRANETSGRGKKENGTPLKTAVTECVAENKLQSICIPRMILSTPQQTGRRSFLNCGLQISL